MTSFVPRQRLLALVGAASFVLAGCGVSMGGDAPLATISIASKPSAEISRSQVEAALDDIAGSERFVQVIYGGAMTPADQQGVLTQLIRGEVLRSEAADLGVSPSAEQLEAAKSVLQNQLVQVASNVDPGDSEGAAAELRSELGEYFDQIAENLATNTAIRDLFAEESEGGVPCVSHILVGPEDEALADDLLAQLNDGADFAALAQENSTDPGSGANGGDLGCADPQGYVPEFRDAVIAAEVDELVGPVKTDFGYHLIKVTGYQNTEAIDARFATIFDDVEIAVDPVFGAWDPATQSVVDAVAP